MLGRKNAQIPTKSCGSIKLTFTPTMFLVTMNAKREVAHGTMYRILTKAGALSIRSDSRGNRYPYSEGVSFYSPPLNREKDSPYDWRPFQS